MPHRASTGNVFADSHKPKFKKHRSREAREPRRCNICVLQASGSDVILGDEGSALHFCDRCITPLASMEKQAWPPPRHPHWPSLRDFSGTSLRVTPKPRPAEAQFSARGAQFQGDLTLEFAAKVSLDSARIPMHCCEDFTMPRLFRGLQTAVPEKLSSICHAVRAAHFGLP